ncbi:MAG: glycosyltransferase family 2 protein [Candidatus Thalassarchaeaceae archaeon]|nr:MAG: hypothetical protein CMA04_001260 [Euryarchaeota archaeon]RPG74031.1 MAG: glycosyltransferase family 2 protein [Euryarchaeota archaeon TMED85]|tara:strand:- start:3296 stop:4228 length:933 start_codon:yes stop_codon:yes gene_type:complete
MHVAVVMPARNEEELIAFSINSVPDIVECLIVVDDSSIDSTAKIALNSLQKLSSSRSLITKLISGNGEGVGSAILLGISELAETVENHDDWAVVIMAGDGQMDPNDLENLVSGLEFADHVKGNRFHHNLGTKNMPLIRRIASKTIGFLTSLATGWNWGDPQCGYTATRLSMILRHSRLYEWQGYGYPNWWALCFSESSESVKEVPVKSVYGSEKSGIRIVSFLPKVSMMLFLGIWRRGWSWYILGKGKKTAHFMTRLIVSILWFISWAMLFISIADYRLLLIPFTLFAILRFIDNREQKERSRFSTEFEM